MRKMLIFLTLFVGMLIVTQNVYAHCEVPCGIYDDQKRIDIIHEHIMTIQKSMTKIEELSGQENVNHNQLVRWINNKDEHASKIQEIVYQYFMTQRIKPKSADDETAYEKYIKELTLLHKLLVSAMKTKQTIDSTHTTALHNTLDVFAKSYLGEAKEEKGSPKGSHK